MIYLLDTTLRDGGHLINGKFSEREFRSIIKALVDGLVEYIEIGWVGPHEYSGFSTFTSSLTPLIAEIESLDIGTSKLLFMVRPDLTRAREVLFKPISKLSRVRLAFYFRHLDILKNEIREWQDLGVEVWLNPIDLPGYSQKQVDDVARIANENKVACVSIVDTYGVLTLERLRTISSQLEENLEIEISIGLHSHDNIQLSLALASEIIQNADSRRRYVIDASLLGMGRAPGNLKLELIAPVLNNIGNSNYALDPILSILEDVIYPLHNRQPWGYNTLYAYSSLAGIDRTYAEHLLSIKSLTLNQKVEIMGTIGRMGPEYRAFSQSRLEEAIEIAEGKI